MNIKLDNNNITLEIKSDDKFNSNLLNELSDNFSKLDNTKRIEVNIIGKIPIEVGPYAMEVSKHCKELILILDKDDDEAYDMLSGIFKYSQSNIKLRRRDG